ncbi:MAG: thymidylate synthase [archaeon]
MEAYLNICREILDKGKKEKNRTGTDAYIVPIMLFRHDMKDGFPLLTTKKVAYGNVRSELEFFINGVTDKKWLQDRNNHIWNEWCTPMKIAYAHDDDTKARMKEERDLGPLYGWQWRHFGAEYKGIEGIRDSDGMIISYENKGIDQLSNLVDALKNAPDSRRILCMAWNPADVDKVVPPFCHYGFQVDVVDGKLDLAWNQRSVDVPLGLPFNIASYGTLLHLLAKEAGLEEGILGGFLMNNQIYVDQVEGIEEQVSRKPKKLPKIETEKFGSVFDWNFMDTKIIGYDFHPAIKFPIAV